MYSAIFDMDGTLIDTQKVYIDAWEIAGRNQGIEGLGGIIKYVCGLKHEDSLKFAKNLYPTLDTERLFAEYMPYAQANKRVELLPGVTELLDFLYARGIKMAIASSSPMSEIKENVERLGLSKYFSAFVSGYDVKNGKPAPDVFLAAAEKLGTPPDECFVFEDSPNGVRAAYNAGMKCFGIPDVALFTDEVCALAYKVIDSIDQAIDVLKEEE